MDNECLKVPQSLDDLAGIDRQIQDIYTQVFAQNDGTMPLYDLYAEVGSKFPYFTRSELRQKALSAIASDNPDRVRIGTNIILANYMRTIMRVVGQYLTIDPDFNNELVQNVLADVRESIPSLSSTLSISHQIHKKSQYSADRYISNEFEVPIDWVERGISREVMQAVDTLFASFPHGLDETNINFHAFELSKQLNIPMQTILNYIEHINKIFINGEPTLNEKDSTYNDAIRNIFAKNFDEILNDLSERDRLVFVGIYFEGKTGRELAKELDLSHARIWQIEDKCVRRLRRILYIGGFRDYFD